MAIVAALQDLEHKWSVGGVILIVTRGRSKPPRHLEVSTPGRGAEEKKRSRSGPEYPLHGPSTRHHFRSRHPILTTATIQTPQSTVTASVDGLVGYASFELVVLASLRSIRCLYRYKDFRCLTKRYNRRCGRDERSSRRRPVSRIPKMRVRRLEWIHQT